MLVLKRRDGQWVEITHVASGETVRVRAYQIDGRTSPPTVNLAFDDDAKHFRIEREERLARVPGGPTGDLPRSEGR